MENLVVVPTDGSRALSSDVWAIALPPPHAKDLDSLRALVRRLANEKKLIGNQESF
jgi:hypothetical protein